ncbi:hypothetical protein PR048_029354 [Dryococelus australis]|uniref:Tc1-like transposase DDE domain-containing protein n=1 Tax=Dryococelus australis TaxID=614101 RepID=A0ABQ9GDH5_9NEOP|nr:hypothetical protein PR048_029354 [Dryococelus australis]
MDPCYFQDGNARCHISRATMQWYADNNVRRLDWPAQSHDLNPMEHLWDELDRRVRARQARPKFISQLMEWLQEEWRRIPVDVLQTLVQSMPDRVAAVIAARGSALHCYESTCLSDPNIDTCVGNNRTVQKECNTAGLRQVLSKLQGAGGSVPPVSTGTVTWTCIKHEISVPPQESRAPTHMENREFHVAGRCRGIFTWSGSSKMEFQWTIWIENCAQSEGAAVVWWADYSPPTLEKTDFRRGHGKKKKKGQWREFWWPWGGQRPIPLPYPLAMPRLLPTLRPIHLPCNGCLPILSPAAFFQLNTTSSLTSQRCRATALFPLRDGLPNLDTLKISGTVADHEMRFPLNGITYGGNVASKPSECTVKGSLIRRPSRGKRYEEFAHVSCHEVVGTPQHECDERLLGARRINTMWWRVSTIQTSTWARENFPRSLGISKTSVLRTLRQRKFHPYHVALHQALREVRWPIRSPDLKPLDFFPWGTLKDRVHKTIPTTPEDMQERIVAAFRGVTPASETLQATRRSLHVRLQDTQARKVELRMCFPESPNVCDGVIAAAKGLEYKVGQQPTTRCNSCASDSCNPAHRPSASIAVAVVLAAAASLQLLHVLAEKQLNVGTRRLVVCSLRYRSTSTLVYVLSRTAFTINVPTSHPLAGSCPGAREGQLGQNTPETPARFGIYTHSQHTTHWHYYTRGKEPCTLQIGQADDSPTPPFFVCLQLSRREDGSKRLQLATLPVFSRPHLEEFPLSDRGRRSVKDKRRRDARGRAYSSTNFSEVPGKNCELTNLLLSHKQHTSLRDHLPLLLPASSERAALSTTRECNQFPRLPPGHAMETKFTSQWPNTSHHFSQGDTRACPRTQSTSKFTASYSSDLEVGSRDLRNLSPHIVS